MDWPVTYTRKVRFSDSDAQGIVFNGNYLAYFDDAITDYFDAIGLSWDEFNARGYDIVLGHVEIDFKSPGRIGATLVTGARVAKIGTSSVTFELRTWDEATGETVVEGKEVHVVVDHESLRPCPVPEFFIEAVTGLQEAPPER